MIMLAVVLAGLAAYLIMPVVGGRHVLRRLAADESVSPPSGRSRRWLILAPIGLAVPVVGFMIGGPRGAVYAVVAVIVAGLALRLATGGGRRIRAVRAEAEVADACRALAAEVRVGKIPAEALASVAADHPILAEADRIHRLGGDVTRCWRDRAYRPGHGGLLDLARGWELCQATGAPLSVALDQIADNLVSDQTIRMTVAGELAAPRASGKIMAALPLLGIGLGYLIGGDPMGFLWHEPLGWGCLLVGAALAATGILWIDGLASRAEHG
jgi:tight adherence protein B